METFSASLAFCAGNSPVTGEFPSQRPVTRNLFLWSAPWINGWVNNREGGDLRRHRAHYDVIVMICMVSWLQEFESDMEQVINQCDVMIANARYTHGEEGRGPELGRVIAWAGYQRNDMLADWVRIQNPITVSHVRHGVPNHQQLECLSNSLLRLANSLAPERCGRN